MEKKKIKVGDIFDNMLGSKFTIIEVNHDLDMCALEFDRSKTRQNCFISGVLKHCIKINQLKQK